MSAAEPKVGQSQQTASAADEDLLSFTLLREMLSNAEAFVVFLVEGFPLYTSGHDGAPSSIYQRRRCLILTVLCRKDLQSHTAAVIKPDNKTLEILHSLPVVFNTTGSCADLLINYKN